jgi:hypothetical protein
MELEPGESHYTQYEICGFVFRMSPPRLRFREEGGKTWMRVEMEMETHPPAPTGEASEPRSPAGTEGTNPHPIEGQERKP